MKKKLYRSKTNKKLLGVCGGIADFFDIDVTIIRLIMVFATVFFGMSFWVYIIAALVMPEDPGYTPYSEE